jgi:hypothetical protein
VYPGCAIQPDALYEQDPVFEPKKPLAHSSLNNCACVVIDNQILGVCFFPGMAKLKHVRRTMPMHHKIIALQSIAQSK